MDYIEKKIQNQEITEAQLKDVRTRMADKFDKLSINNQEVKERTDFRNEVLSECDINMNRYLQSKLSIDFEEHDAAMHAGGVESPKYEYRKLSYKEKCKRRFEYWGSKKDYPTISIESVNLKHDIMEAEQEILNSRMTRGGEHSRKYDGFMHGHKRSQLVIGEYHLNEEHPVSEEDRQYMEADKNRMDKLLSEDEAVAFGEIRKVADEIFAFKLEDKTATEEYFLTHAKDVVRITKKARSMKEYWDEKPSVLRHFNDDEYNLLAQKLKLINFYRIQFESVCKKYGLNTSNGEFDWKYCSPSAAQLYEDDVNTNSWLLSENIVKFQMSEARFLSKKAKGKAKDYADLYLARLKAHNNQIDVAGCKIKRSIDALRKRQFEITGSVVRTIKSKGKDINVDPALIRAFIKDDKYNENRKKPSDREDAALKWTNETFVETYINKEEDRYFFVEYLVNELMDSKIDFTKLDEQDVINNPNYYVSVVDQYRALSGLMKDPKNAEFFDNMPPERKEKLKRIVLPKFQCIRNYIGAVYSKHGYDLYSGDYLTAGGMKDSLMEAESIMYASMEGLNDLKHESVRMDSETVLLTKDVHESRAQELKLRHFMISNLETEPLNFENKELVDYVVDGYTQALRTQFEDATSTGSAMSAVSQKPEGILFKELLAKAVPDTLVKTIIDEKDIDACIVEIAQFIEGNSSVKEIIERVKSAYPDELADDVKMQYVFQSFVEGVIVPRISNAYNVAFHDESLRLTKDIKNREISRTTLENQARDNVNADKYINKNKKLKDAVRVEKTATNWAMLW